MFCREVFHVSDTLAGSRIECAAGSCRFAVHGSNRLRPLKCLSPPNSCHGIAPTVRDSCNRLKNSLLPSSSLPDERSSIPLTPHRICLSLPKLACLPTRPLFLRLRIRRSLPRLPSALAQPHRELPSEQYHMPSTVICLSFHPGSLTPKLSQAIQIP